MQRNFRQAQKILQKNYKYHNLCGDNFQLFEENDSFIWVDKADTVSYDKGRTVGNQILKP